jgi:hypothetical protein
LFNFTIPSAVTIDIDSKYELEKVREKNNYQNGITNRAIIPDSGIERGTFDSAFPC